MFGSRFGRRRKRNSTGIDAQQWMTRILDSGLLNFKSLEPYAAEGVPSFFAATGVGVLENGERVAVGFAPRAGGDALLGVLALASQLNQVDGFSGQAVAIAPQWYISGRKRLALLGSTPFRCSAVAAPGLAEGDVDVEPAPADDPVGLSPNHVAGQLLRTEDRELFQRAASGLVGIAAKHEGAVRGLGRSIELVIMARRVAALRFDSNGVHIDFIAPHRSSERLDDGSLPDALDKLEGYVRKRLGDNRVRNGEDGFRARLLPTVLSAVKLRSVQRWPLGGSDQDAVDFAGIDERGRIVVGAVRRRMSLKDLGTIIDAVVSLRPAFPHLFSESEPPVLFDAPRICLAAEAFDSAVLRVLGHLVLDTIRIDLQRAETAQATAVVSKEILAPPPRDRSRGRSAPAREEEAKDGSEAVAAATSDSLPSEQTVSEQAGSEDEAEAGASSRGRSQRRRRGRGGRGRRGERSPTDSQAENGKEASTNGESEPREAKTMEFLELDALDEEEKGTSRRRRGRGRRGRRPAEAAGKNSDDSQESEGTRRDAGDSSADEESSSSSSRRRGRGRGQAKPDAIDEGIESGQYLTLSAEELDFSDLDDADEDAVEEGLPLLAGLATEPSGEDDALIEEAAEGAAVAPISAVEEPAPQRARNVAIVAHADRDSVAASLLLARDARTVDGFWVYPQEDLMTFFRSVATDLREDTPIFLVGFTASPAHDTIQTASLYGGRIYWFDHHEWPPEDLEAMRSAIGAPFVHVNSDSESALPSVLRYCTRRSRFSDKLVELITGRFSEHDYENWGRLWWSRLGEIAVKAGDRRSDIDPLLAGRPSDLAKEAAECELPPLPPELQFVAGKDFRLVHFGGYTLVLVPCEQGLDLHLTARIARERYEAEISLAWVEGSEVFLLAGDDRSSTQSLNVVPLVDHMATKFVWLESLDTTDRVARLKAKGVWDDSTRFDSLIAEIAMGRTTLER